MKFVSSIKLLHIFYSYKLYEFELYIVVENKSHVRINKGIIKTARLDLNWFVCACNTHALSCDKIYYVFIKTNVGRYFTKSKGKNIFGEYEPSKQLRK